MCQSRENILAITEFFVPSFSLDRSSQDLDKKSQLLHHVAEQDIFFRCDYFSIYFAIEMGPLIYKFEY